MACALLSSILNAYVQKNFGRFGALEPIWTASGRRTPTAQYGELRQAKPQACVQATESEFSAVGMAVGRLLDA